MRPIAAGEPDTHTIILSEKILEVLIFGRV
jgi:hypothetical protein